MLDNLLEIEVAYSLLKDDKSDSATANPIDVHYERLKANIVVSLRVIVFIIVFVILKLDGRWHLL